jgi:hypothetical protein
MYKDYSCSPEGEIMGYDLNQSSVLSRRLSQKSTVQRDISPYDLSAVAAAARALAARPDPPPQLESLYDLDTIARIDRHFGRR